MGKNHHKLSRGQAGKEISVRDNRVHNTHRSSNILRRAHEHGISAHHPQDKLTGLTERAIALNKKVQEIEANTTKLAKGNREELVTALTDVFMDLDWLAMLIHGDYDKRSSQATSVKMYQTTTKNLNLASTKALDSATNADTQVGKAETDLIALHDGDMGQLNKDIADYLIDINDQVATQASIIKVLGPQCEENRKVLQGLQGSLADARAKYRQARNDAHSMQAGNIVLWIFCWPAGLAVQKLVTDKLHDACHDLENNVHTLEASFKTANKQLKEDEAKLNNLHATQTRAMMVAAQIEQLEHRVTDSQDFAEKAARHFADLKTKLQNTETLVGRLSATSEANDTAIFSKETIISNILDIIHDGLCDPRLIELKDAILATLSDDDPQKEIYPTKFPDQLKVIDSDTALVQSSWQTAADEDEKDDSQEL